MPSEAEKIHTLLDEHILTQVSQPGQYVGNEPGSIKKDLHAAAVSVALCFPDTYAIGMSHLGYQILYDIINSRRWAAAERVYAPWVDMQEKMREHNLPLFTVESFSPVKNFDLVGFTLQSELLYSNVLMMLDLAGLPLKSKERSASHPLIIAGGPGALAPEPLAEFIDIFFIGDGEESFPEFLDFYREQSNTGKDRKDILIGAARNISGLYVPMCYRQEFGPGDKLTKIQTRIDGAPDRIMARHVKNLDAAPFPTNPVVPLVETTHERINLEIMRGCARGCRFCHAGMTGRPQRLRSPDTLFKQAVECYRNTGYDEIALSSLSSSDYPYLAELLEKLTEYFTPLSVGISLPSLRVSGDIENLVGPLKAVRKSGLTLAPEAATQRLRDIIKKNITTVDLYNGTAAAARAGWKLIKLYFMVGLPGEEPEDIDAIGPLCNDIIARAKKEAGKKPLKLNVTISPFVPKPHTPMQWEPMDPLNVLKSKWKTIRLSGSGKLRYKWHDPAQSVVEAALARGDRRMGNVLLEAYRNGACFDAWNDRFDFNIWRSAMEAHGMHMEDNHDNSHPNSPFRRREEGDFLPWDHIDCGANKNFLLAEKKRAFAANE